MYLKKHPTPLHGFVAIERGNGLAQKTAQNVWETASGRRIFAPMQSPKRYKKAPKGRVATTAI
jgi:hypothetical protein